MGVEIERKFLVNERKWASMEKTNGQFVQQGYLLTDPDKTIRIRVTDGRGYLTIKGLTTGATRKEFEYEIPNEEATELLNTFSVSGLTKIRYTISHRNTVWQVDEFKADNTGLIIAEVELQNESQNFDKPDWIEEEVTQEEKYYNSNLSLHPFKHWKKN